MIPVNKQHITVKNALLFMVSPYGESTMLATIDQHEIRPVNEV